MIERGFCLNKEFVGPLKASGLPDKLIYLDGRGAEDLDRCLASFRNRPGRLLVAPDLTVFGQSKKDITETMAKLERAKIQVADVVHPQDETLSEKLSRAYRRIDGRRYPDKRAAKRRGSLGGLEKARRAAAARLGIDPSWLITQLVNEPAVSWPVKLRILDGKISESTLRRQYLVMA